MDELEKELKVEFLSEAATLLEDAEAGFLVLEDDPTNQDTINMLFRVAHNLKGTSRAVGFSDMAEFTHATENILLKLKEGEMVPTPEIISLLLRCKDNIAVMVAGLEEDLNASFDSSELIAEIEQTLAGGGEATAAPVAVEEPENSAPGGDELVVPVEPAEPSLSADTPPDMPESVFDDGFGEVPTADMFAEVPVEPESEEPVSAEPTTAVPTAPAPAAAPVTAEHSPVDNVVPIKEDAPPTPEKPKATKPAEQAGSEEKLRVPLARVETLNDVVGELVILQSVLEQAVRDAGTGSYAEKAVAQLGKLSREIQEISMSLRMVTVQQTFQKLRRIVRDTSKALSKSIDLEILGADTEIDKTVLDRLADPLVHIVRNAIDHGLEVEADRLAAGKSPAGNLKISAGHEGDSLVIRVVDDGNGIDPAIIKRKAIEKGVIKSNSTLDDQGIVNLIFAAGFSTKEQVSEVSGRGVGMDVVRTNVEALGGSVTVESHLGAGSTFTIKLPLTLAIIEGMIVDLGQDTVIIPMNQVSEMVSITQEQLKEVSGMGKCLQLRGEIIPVLNLAEILNKKAHAGGRIAIITELDKKFFAFEVHDIVRQQQVVVKKLGEELPNRSGIMGGSIMGNGKPALIVDIIDLLNSSKKASGKAAA